MLLFLCFANLQLIFIILSCKQVEWDEPGCSDKHNRVSSWEIETPESLFIFPSLTSGLKRPLQSGFLGELLASSFFNG